MRGRGRATSCSSLCDISCIPIPSLPSENNVVNVVAITVVDVVVDVVDARLFVCVCARACALKLRGNNLPPKPGSFSYSSSIPPSLTASISPSLFSLLAASEQE